MGSENSKYSLIEFNRLSYLKNIIKEKRRIFCTPISPNNVSYINSNSCPPGIRGKNKKSLWKN